jgi:hypothetical protein
MIEWRFVIPVGTVIALAFLAWGCSHEDRATAICANARRSLVPYELCKADPQCRLSKDDYFWYSEHQRDITQYCNPQVEK